MPTKTGNDPKNPLVDAEDQKPSPIPPLSKKTPPVNHDPPMDPHVQPGTASPTSPDLAAQPAKHEAPTPRSTKDPSQAKKKGLPSFEVVAN